MIPRVNLKVVQIADRERPMPTRGPWLRDPVSRMYLYLHRQTFSTCSNCCDLGTWTRMRAGLMVVDVQAGFDVRVRDSFTAFKPP